ncbi:hypothetical protein [Corynebacterium pilosum]|uniref:Uncharacterized protein n=1 Tax=Corynebacterium pilosum TaxID=35756 RepID=A0A376CKS1_9CORY|nr:hypothetical protein [Corynebacterium pilosum]STC68278.1 Uncharacterised protein [Corynebacterium pilosum]
MSAALAHASIGSLGMKAVHASECLQAPWGVSSISDDIAHVPLSRDFRAVLYDDAGRGLTYHDLGRMGLSVHAAWDLAARELLAKHSSSEGVEFLVRDAPCVLSGVQGWDIANARQWMAHPSTFTVLHRHLTTLVGPKAELSYAVRPDDEVAVYSCAPGLLRAGLSARGEAADVVAYSLGFPVVR